jgi:hypothetical protein
VQPTEQSVPGERARIFLCHSRRDKEAVRELYARLRESEFDPWLDTEDILPGRNWEHEIAKAVRGAAVVIVCLSHHAVNTAGYAHKEITFALDEADKKPEGAIYVIPLKLEECTVPDRLSRWQWVELFAADGYKKLVDALRHKAPTISVTAPHTTSPIVLGASKPPAPRADFFAKLWRDPVWSKVIATGIVAVVGALGVLLSGILRPPFERSTSSGEAGLAEPKPSATRVSKPEPMSPDVPTAPAPSIEKEPLR